jgi:hypothetical protein
MTIKDQAVAFVVCTVLAVVFVIQMVTKPQAVRAFYYDKSTNMLIWKAFEKLIQFGCTGKICHFQPLSKAVPLKDGNCPIQITDPIEMR